VAEATIFSVWTSKPFAREAWLQKPVMLVTSWQRAGRRGGTVTVDVRASSLYNVGL
jgi:hypothetical protein